MYPVIKSMLVGLLFCNTIQVKSQHCFMHNMYNVVMSKLEFVKVEITGNKKTHASYILRELPFAEHDNLFLKDIDSLEMLAKQQLINTRLFLSVEIKHQIEGQVIVFEIAVSERNFFFPSLIFELADNDFDVWWREQMRDPDRINYGAAISWRNISGFNDRLAASYSTGFRENFQISYSHPAIDKKQRLGVSVAYNHQYNREIGYTLMINKLSVIKDNDFISAGRKIMLSLSYRKSLFARHSLYLVHNSLQVADTILKLNPVYINNANGNANYTELAYKFKYLRVDNLSYPLKGIFFSFQISYAGILQKDDIRMSTIGLRVQSYKQVGKEKIYVSTMFDAFGSAGKQLPFSKQAELGKQTNHIRGFQFYNLLGSGIFIVKQEIKYEALKQIIKLNFLPEKFKWINIQLYPKVFADAGSIYNTMPGDNSLLNKWLFSFGAGVDLVSYYDSVISAEFISGLLLKPGLYIRWRTIGF